MVLQIKEKRSRDAEIRLSYEYDKAIEFIPECIDEKDLQNIWKDYRFGNVKLMGFLITDRKIIEKEGIEVDVDKNIYEGNIDYEIEIEYEGDTEIVDNIIESMKLKGKLHQGKGKYERFKEISVKENRNKP